MVEPPRAKIADQLGDLAVQPFGKQRDHPLVAQHNQQSEGPIGTCFACNIGDLGGSESSSRLQFDSPPFCHPIISIGTFGSVVGEGIPEDKPNFECECELE